jgi:putative DNA primase/helicase
LASRPAYSVHSDDRQDRDREGFPRAPAHAELPGILNWALDGLASYRKQGLNPPETVLASTQEYREDMDVVGQWIAERCEVDPRASVPTSIAYDDYSYWAPQEVGWALNKPRFRRQLSDRGFAAVKGAHGQRMIQGLRLKTTDAAVAPARQTAADVGELPELNAAISALSRVRGQPSRASQ